MSNYIAHLIEDAGAEESFGDMIAAWVKDSGATEEELLAAEEQSRVAFERAGLDHRRDHSAKARRKAG